MAEPTVDRDRTKKYQSADIHRETMLFVDEMTREFTLYPEILDVLRNGRGSVELRKRILLRAIDETWVTVIEDSLPALEEAIRNPSRFITEEEKVLPIEQTRALTSRSVKHLAQHTDYISRVDGDSVTPTKMLNVFREETIQTYENKFVNTLLDRLYTFVQIRYDAALASGQDTKNTSVEFKNDFSHGSVRGKLLFRIEIDEPAGKEDGGKNYIHVSDLWKRVEKLRRVCGDYMQSSFVREMGNSYVRPPVMRTNALLKNKNLRQCLALWEFIERYENTGYTTMVEDSLYEMDESYIRELYSTMAVEYLLFRSHVDKGFEADTEIATASTEEPLNPEIISELSPATAAEFALHIAKIDREAVMQTEEDTQVLRVLEVALLADEVYRNRARLRELPEATLDVSFMGKLILAQDPAQQYYCEIKNLLLSYRGAKSRTTWKYETFQLGKTVTARLVVKGKTLVIYLPLDPQDEKYRSYSVIDMSRSSGYKAVPMGIRVRSRKALVNVLQLIREVMERLQAMEDPSAKRIEYRFPLETKEELVARGVIKQKGAVPNAEPEPEAPSEEPASALPTEEPLPAEELLEMPAEEPESDFDDEPEDTFPDEPEEEPEEEAEPEVEPEPQPEPEPVLPETPEIPQKKGFFSRLFGKRGD